MNTQKDSPSPSGTSRRSFLKTSATAASVAALGGLDLSRSAHAAGSDTLKVGLIGCGGRGSGAAVNCMNGDPSVRLVAMADIFVDRVESSRENLRKANKNQVGVENDHCFAGIDGAKKVIASDVDLVLIACASKFHPEYLKACVEAGKHVFVEKPNAIDPPGVRMVLAAAEEAKKKKLCVASGLMSRYSPAWRETVKRVHDGAIGEVVAAESNFLRAPYQLVEPKPGWSEIEYQYRNWYHFTWLSGDDVIQSLVHNVDRISWAMQERLPVKAHRLGGRAAMVGKIYGNVFDHHSVIYEYDNGARLYAFCSTHTGCHGDYSDTLHGTKGRCELMKATITGENKWRFKGPEANMYDVEHQELVAAIRAGTPINDGVHMAHSAMFGILGQMACYTGRQLTWEEALASDFKFGPDKCDFSMEPPVKPDEKGIYPVAMPGFTKLA